MLSKNHIKYRDLAGYIFSYDRNTVESAEVWARQHSTGFEPGMMVFCLEKVTPQSAMVVGRKDDGDSYKVSDLCFVVGEDDNRALGVNITSNVYDLRFIEVLLCEKAQKAILNEKDFLYVTTKPAKQLDQTKIHEIEQVGAVYAMGGSRRALVVDTNGPNEPAMALLTLMGANITPTGIGRQLLDIGNVCSLLFSSDSRQQDDQNKLLIRSIYVPIASGQAVNVNDQAAIKAQAASVWQGPTGDVSAAAAPPAPNFNQSSNTPPVFTGAPPTWGVPPKFEETKTPASNNQSFVADITAPAKPADFNPALPPSNYHPQANSPFQEIPQAPPMDFGGQFAPPAPAVPQSPAAAPEAPPAAPSMPDFSAPTEFEQHFNSQPYFEEQPQSTPASELELRQAYEQAPPVIEQPTTPQYADAPLESAWFSPSEPVQNVPEPANDFAIPENPPSGFAPPTTEAPAVIPPRFPSSMYGSSTAAAIPQQAPLDESTQFVQDSIQSNPVEQFNTPEPAAPAVPAQDAYVSQVQEPTPATSEQPVVAETASAENMALPSLEELGIQPLGQPEEHVAQPDQSAQWWSAQEMQKPLLEPQSESNVNVGPTAESNLPPANNDAYVDQPQASPTLLAWGSEPEVQTPPTPSMPEGSSPIFTPESIPVESFMHAQPVEPGNITPIPEPVEAFQTVPNSVDEVNNNPALLWMAEDQNEPDQAVSEIAQPSVEKAPDVPEIPAPTFFEQAAQAIRPEIPASPFASVQKTNPVDTSPVVAPEVTNEADLGSVEPSEDTLILSTVKDAQIQANNAVASAPKPKPQTVQDPKLVMKETALLMSKLEHQVAEAAKRLNSRSEAVKQRLNRQVEELLQAANDAEKNSQNQTTDLSGRLSTHITNLSEEIRQQLTETASSGRYTIKQLLSTNQSDLEAKQTALEDELKAVCAKFREDSENFAQEAQKKLQELVEAKTAEIESLTDGVLEHLDDTNADFVKTFEGRFNRFKERIADEAASVKQSLERNVRSMFEEVEGSWERASEKLKDNQRDFEQRISHSVKSAKLISSENSKQMIATSIFPLVKERRVHLQKLIDELTKRFQQESSKQAEAQLNGLEASLTEARHQLQNLVSDCLESINAVGKQQQAGLEEAFKDTSVQAESATVQVKTLLSEAHSQITETEAVCRSLVESSNLDTEVELTEVRNTTAQSIKTAKQEANSKLQETIEEHSNNLDRLSNKVQTEINSERLKQTKAAREASEVGLTRLREAIQEAVAAVQAAREKYME
ncbi:MAG: hypothetical protein P4L53_20165 [Candidatus Obscuribacterales bacterium]|nr:hypothetical protein [Candidatus Obscuribacterales bacterium]